jgi:site-specific recombinase XerD
MVKAEDLPPEWADALLSFRRHLERTKASNTAQVYERGVRFFFAWLAPRPFSLTLPPNTLQLFVDSALSEGKNPSSLKTYVFGIRKFLEWLKRQGLQVPFFDEVEWPKQAHYLPPKALPADVFKMYLSWVDANAKEPYRTAMLLLPHCGLRISELITLRLDSIERVNGGVLLVARGKGAKWRRVPLLRSFIPVLAEYLKGWRDAPTRRDSVWLFPAPGRPKVHLDRRGLTAKMTACSRALGHPLTAHTMRRQYATALHKAGVPLATIAKVLGHADPKTSHAHYVSLDGQDLVDAIRRVDI